MLKHIALFRLKDEAAGADKAANIARIEANVAELRRAVPFARRIEVGTHRVVTGVDFPGFDLCVLAELANEADYIAYIRNPTHQKARDFAASVSETVSAITYVADD